MPKMNAGNRLYFYQLLSRELGVGKQVSLAQVEELFEQHELYPEDVECASVLSLLEELGEAVRITTFKKGRVYVTAQSVEELEEQLAKIAEKPGGKDAGKSWRRKRGGKVVRPERPHHVPRPAPVAEPEPEPAEELKPADTPEPAVAAPEPGTVPAPTPEATPTPKPEPKPEEPAHPSDGHISLNITYVPEDVLELEQEMLAAPTPQEPEPAEAPRREDSLLAHLPQDLYQEVYCNDTLLRLLYQLLPADVEPMAVLDEDWRVARSCGLVSGTRSRVSFPLRYLHADGKTPVEVTLRRSGKSSAGKGWSLAYVDGEDGSGSAHEEVGLEGLPQAQEGAWELLGPSESTSSPLRELAQLMVVGSWDGLLGSLASVAAPERWNYPWEGVERGSRYGILREYLACTLHRVRAEGKLAVATDGSLAAFNTGLLTPFSEDVFAVLEPRQGDIPWSFLGFCCAGSGELGGRMVASLEELPRAASYLASLDDATVETGRLLVLDGELLLGDQLGRLPRGWLSEQLSGNSMALELLGRLEGQEGSGERSATLGLLGRAVKDDPGLHRRLNRALDDAAALALRRVQASYRLAVPAFDPRCDGMRLLVPLCLVRDGHADCALVLAKQPSGNYRGISLMPLAQAHACARVISAEQPNWLAR